MPGERMPGFWVLMKAIDEAPPKRRALVRLRLAL